MYCTLLSFSQPMCARCSAQYIFHTMWHINKCITVILKGHITIISLLPIGSEESIGSYELAFPKNLSWILLINKVDILTPNTNAILHPKLLDSELKLKLWLVAGHKKCRLYHLLQGFQVHHYLRYSLPLYFVSAVVYHKNLIFYRITNVSRC